MPADPIYNDETMKIIIPLLFCLLTVAAVDSAAQTPSDSDAKILRSEKFKMSELAEKAGIDGTVVLSIRVDEKGDVRSAEVVAGPSWPCGQDPKGELNELRAAIKENVLASKFSPAIRNGKPKAADMWIKFSVGEAFRDAARKRELEEAMKSGKPLSVKFGVLNGRALKLPTPAYPSAAKAARASGTVPVEVEIDEQGNVARAGAVGGLPVLQSSARTAACEAKFAPTILQGNPVRVHGVITYNFNR